MRKDHSMPIEHPIRRYCQDRELTQRDFADLVGLSEGYVSQMIAGHYECGKNAALQIVTKTGGKIQLEELLTWES